eukprot:TRINITY_DN12109_c0_g1_i1.p2 TRINITY_DN12109_c0_g1~~TRINITY_DN12109_c0_g1_i1.p2  ORF type:complete len:187 (-),score=24.77 TRINITY_DN12109_c0_g1_i1:49-609(-)
MATSPAAVPAGSRDPGLPCPALAATHQRSHWTPTAHRRREADRTSRCPRLAAPSSRNCPSGLQAWAHRGSEDSDNPQRRVQQLLEAVSVDSLRIFAHILALLPTVQDGRAATVVVWADVLAIGVRRQRGFVDKLLSQAVSASSALLIIFTADGRMPHELELAIVQAFGEIAFWNSNDIARTLNITI